jgi:peptide/nickel transport system ATP-binding protein
MICDLDPNQGEVFLGGVARSSMTAPAWRRQVVYVPAESGWWTDHIADHFRKDQVEPARALCARLALPDGILDQPVSRLSTGERQRLALIRAFVANSPVLLLDEPTSALDVSVQAEVLNLLADLQQRRGLTYLMVSHNLAVVAHLCPMIGVMLGGEMVEQLSADDLRHNRIVHPHTAALRALSTELEEP